MEYLLYYNNKDIPMTRVSVYSPYGGVKYWDISETIYL